MNQRSTYEQLSFIDGIISDLNEETMHMSFVRDMEQVEPFERLTSWNEAALPVIFKDRDRLSWWQFAAIGRIAAKRNLPPVNLMDKLAPEDQGKYEAVKTIYVDWGIEQGYAPSPDK